MAMVSTGKHFFRKSRFNQLQDDKVLDWSKLKQITDDILKCIESEK